MKETTKKNWMVGQFRRLMRKWKPWSQVRNNAKIELPRKIKKDGTPYKKPNFGYRCAKCDGIFKSTEIAVDHINPVIDPKNELIQNMSLEAFIGKFAVNLFCDESNLQVLCHPCHDQKSSDERDIRTKTKKKS